MIAERRVIVPRVALAVWVLVALILAVLAFALASAAARATSYLDTGHPSQRLASAAPGGGLRTPAGPPQVTRHVPVAAGPVVSPGPRAERLVDGLEGKPGARPGPSRR